MPIHHTATECGLCKHREMFPLCCTMARHVPVGRDLLMDLVRPFIPFSHPSSGPATSPTHTAIRIRTFPQSFPGEMFCFLTLKFILSPLRSLFHGLSVKILCLALHLYTGTLVGCRGVCVAGFDRGNPYVEVYQKYSSFPAESLRCLFTIQLDQFSL